MKNCKYYADLELSIRSASLYRSVECLSKLAPHHLSQDKRFGKAKNSFKLRLRPTQPLAPQPEPLKVRVVRPSVSRDNAERAESGSSGGKRELFDAKGRLFVKIKLSKDYVRSPAGASLYLSRVLHWIDHLSSRCLREMECPSLLQCQFNRNWCIDCSRYFDWNLQM